MNKLLYICNWTFKDGLTQATVLPNLKPLVESGRWDEIIFATLESGQQQPEFLHSGIMHRPFCMKQGTIRLLDRFIRWRNYRRFLQEIIKGEDVACIIARGAPAGIIAHELSLAFTIPFYVESFEPHADYMAESGVWSRWDPRYIKQKIGEKQVKQRAKGLITVSANYKHYLEKNGVSSEKIQVVPCTVDTGLFRFSNNARTEVRQRLNMPGNVLVGINVGKYGGIYHDEAAFTLFQYLFRSLPDYYQVFLTPDIEEVKKRIAAYGLPEDRCRVALVPNSEVSEYLSAADFGFVLVKSTPAKRFCSPIKTGEYWACGLPVIITEDIGDDSEIIDKTKTGVVWNALPDTLPLVVKNLKTILAATGLREKSQELAAQQRNRRCIVDAYSYFRLI